MSRKAMQVALEALESDPISHAGPVTVLSSGKGTGCGYTNINENWTHLYTAPQKREWAGLTEKEIRAMAKPDHGAGIDLTGRMWVFIADLTDKLKEKNA